MGLLAEHSPAAAHRLEEPDRRIPASLDLMRIAGDRPNCAAGEFLPP